MQVEPALSGDQVADLDKPQQAVIVGGSGEAPEAANRGYRRDDERGGKRLGRIAMPERCPTKPRSGHGHLARHCGCCPVS